jgi:NTE family protein
VVVFQPGAAEQQLMGNDFMSNAHVAQIVQASFLAAGAHAASPEVQQLLRG